MHTVKAMERRFEKEDENMTQMPEQEEAIFVKLGDENSHIPAGKTVIEYELSKLVTPDGKRILAEGIHLKIKGSEKICMIGANGAGKTTLLKKIAEELLNRNDIKAEYMPQTYEDLLDLDVTPVDYLDKTGDKEEGVQELEHTLVHLNTHQMKWSIRFRELWADKRRKCFS